MENPVSFRYQKKIVNLLKSMRKKAYIYPITAYKHKLIPNPYLFNFAFSLENEIEFLNLNRPSKIGILDSFKYICKIDYVFLNWIEDIVDRRGGIFQYLYFVFLIIWCRLMKVKVVWTLHNKLSHYEKNQWLKRSIFRIMVRSSDHILTHSKEGISYYFSESHKQTDKIRYFPHPLEKNFLHFNQNPTIDILIWGSVIPYKGIDVFLKFLYSKGLEKKYKIVIAGKIKPESYEKELLPFAGDCILIENRYVPTDEIKDFISNSKKVVFTYEKSSVLSSGILMDTLSYGGLVIAPNIGAFKDINDDFKIIETYENYDELLDILEKSLKHREDYLPEIEQFIEKNTWSAFANEFFKWIK
jgi:beta-1,4-mannosyltransferase